MTTNYPPLFNISESLQLKWQPSRLFLFLLITLYSLAGFALFYCEISNLIIMLGLLFIIIVGSYSVWKYSQSPVQSWCFNKKTGDISCNNLLVVELKLYWRANIAFMQWKDNAGKKYFQVWWMDQLSPPLRRELRLFMQQKNSVHYSKKYLY